MFTDGDYTEFLNHDNIIHEMQGDLEMFEKYSNFDIRSIDASNIREAIHEEINYAAPIISTRTESNVSFEENEHVKI